MKKCITFLMLSVVLFAGDYNDRMLDRIKAERDSNGSFSFVVMGDNRDGDHVLKAIIDEMNEDGNISFAINNGDVVPDG